MLVELSLVAGGAAAGAVAPPRARADEEEGGEEGKLDVLPFMANGERAPTSEFTTINGFATPPASYGGYGGSSIEGNLVPRYTILAPKNWKAETITKQQKGYSGIDTLYVNPVDKQNRIYVSTFLREGESNKTFSLTDPSKTLTGLATSDYKLQDAIESADNQDFVKRVDAKGRTVYDYDIDSMYGRYLVSMTVDSGRLYAVFVTGSESNFDRDAALIRTAFGSFTILDADVL